MALPVSGPLGLLAIATELGTNTPYSLRSMSNTAGFTIPDAVSEFYGYSPGPPVFGYFLGGAFTSYQATFLPYFRVFTSTGEISSSFNQGAGFNSTVNTAATQSDSKILVGGSFTNYSGSGAGRIVRLNTNGTRDTSFNIGTQGANSTVGTVVVQADDKTIIGGSFTSYSGSAVNRITRINTNGTRDTSFNVGTGFDNGVETLKIQSDGKVLAGGAFTAYSGSTINRITRINTDGTRDTSFNVGTGGANNSVFDIVLQSDGKIVAGGEFTSYSGSSVTRITRINTDGTRDTSYNVGTGFNQRVQLLAIQSDDKILVGGQFTSYSGSTANRIVRLNTNGTIDTSFNTGIGFNALVAGLSVQSDGKILVSGEFSSYSGSIAQGVIRLNTDGTVDNTFNRTAGIGSTGTINVFIQLPNGSIALGGNFTNDRIGYLTFLTDSGSEASRGIVAKSGLNSTVLTAIPQSSGRLLIGGAFTFYSGSTDNRRRLIRINSDGSLDTSFNSGTAGPTGNVRTLVTQSDSKIVVGFEGIFYSGSTVNRIVRINTNGTIDTSFNTGTGGANGNVITSVIQSDEKIIIGGAFTSYSGSSVNRITRINTNGTRDTSFNVGAGADSIVNTSIIQSDSKVLIGGIFGNYSGSSSPGLVRINTDGTRDTSFNVGTGFPNAVTSIALQSDGKVIAVGAFLSYSGSNINRIVRLNTDGTRDTSYNVGTGFNAQVEYVTIDPNTGRAVIGGQFTSYSGSTANRIVRLNTNGTVDTTFVPTGSGFNTTVNFILPYSY